MSCKIRKPTKNGAYEVFNNGMRQRWICGDCKQKQEQRAVNQ